MCVPETFQAVRSSRRDFLKLAAGAAAGTAMAGVAQLTAPLSAEARSINVNNVQDLTHVLHPGFPSFNPAFFPQIVREKSRPLQKKRKISTTHPHSPPT